jgi:hypothetical protein
MTNVTKYNICKGVSTGLTFGTPIVTLALCGDFFRYRSETALSACGIFVVLLTLLFAKDKLLEYVKMPSAFIVSTVMLVFILLIEHIILPMKNICIATMIASGVDEITFKHFYKFIEASLPEISKQYKHIGFLFVSNKKLLEMSHE